MNPYLLGNHGDRKEKIAESIDDSKVKKKAVHLYLKILLCDSLSSLVELVELLEKYSVSDK